MSQPRLTVKDKGYAALMKKLGQAPPTLKVGVYGQAAETIHTADGENETLTIGALAEIHEFGLGNVPERSWLRGYVDENNARISKMLARVAGEVIKNKISAEQGLNLLGLQMVGEIKQRLPNLSPELAASTIKRKGSSATLIDSGQFRSSISHQVEQAGAN